MNKEIKAKLHDEGTFVEFRKQTKKLYKELKDYKLVHKKLNEMFGDEYKQLLNMSDSINKQRKKVKKHLSWWANNNLPEDHAVFFMTFTIADNKNLDRKKIQRILTESVLNNTWDYMLTANYGEENGRLNFQCLAVIPLSSIIIVDERKTCLQGKWSTFDEFHFDFCKHYEKKYGFVVSELVNMEHIDITKLARQMTKAVNRSISNEPTSITTKRGTPYQLSKKAA